jgi:hypothetical protein
MIWDKIVRDKLADMIAHHQSLYPFLSFILLISRINLSIFHEYSLYLVRPPTLPQDSNKYQHTAVAGDKLQLASEGTSDF